jgi:argininosuccinate synthase
LNDHHLVTVNADPAKAYARDDATGFIRLNALRLKVTAKVHRQGK